MTDIIVPLKTFRAVIRKGDYSGTIFEGKNYLLATSGELVMIAKKYKPDKIYTKDKLGKALTIYEQVSLPFNSFGYVGISTIDDLPATEDLLVSILDLLDDLTYNQLLMVKKRVMELQKKHKETAKK